ncbi:hypothetical protein UlMin_036601 [Ulmus minor]
MDSSDFPAGRSPRRELVGPRPTPLRIHKDSHKIKKPPVAPQPSQPPAHPPRQPVIIYTVSPKIIHTNPSDFMNLVQRLTGLSSSSTSSASSSSMTSGTQTGGTNTTSNPFDDSNNRGAISPAARFATIERARPNPEIKNNINDRSRNDGKVLEGMEMDQYGVEPKGLFGGILSPNPASLPPIPPNFFSPPSDSFFHDLSPVLYGNRNFIEGSFMPSPASYFVSPRLPSPNTPSIDLFNNIFSDNL